MLEHVYAIRAADETNLAEQVASANADSLLAMGSLGEGPAVVSIAALDRDGIDRALAVLKKSGLNSSIDDLRAKHGVFVRSSPPKSPEKIAVLFSGQGAQYPGMMRRLAEEVPVARAVIERVDRWMEGQGLPALSPVMFSGQPIPNEVFVIQASILASDLMCWAALREALAEAGLAPEVFTGHSFGDYAALAAVEAWTIEDALFATMIRSNAIEETTDSGGMISVLAPLDRIAPVLRELKSVGHVQAANINAPDQIVIAGTPKALRAAEERFARSGIEIVKLDVPRAFHSSLMASARELLAERIDEVSIRAPKRPYLSSVTRRFETDPEIIRRSLVEQLTAPVNFVEQIERLLKSNVNVFIECGPRGVLASLTRRIAQGEDVAIATTDDRDRPGRFAIAKVKAMLESRRAVPMNHTNPRASTALSLTLLDGEPARELMGRDGFDEFWSRTRPTIIGLIEGLWAAERARSSGEPHIEEPQIEEPQIEESEPSVPAHAPSSESQISQAPGRKELEAFLIDAFAKETGYPPDLIDVDADLEADLGIDTVKQAQVLGKVRDRFNLRTEEKLALRDFPTVGHIARYVEKSLSAAAASGVPAAKISRVPMVDLTQQRTKPPKT